MATTTAMTLEKLRSPSSSSSAASASASASSLARKNALSLLKRRTEARKSWMRKQGTKSNATVAKKTAVMTTTKTKKTMMRPPPPAPYPSVETLLGQRKSGEKRTSLPLPSLTREQLQRRLADPAVQDVLYKKRVEDYSHMDINYLADSEIAARFLREMGEVRNKCVIELQPGFGVLSRLLMNSGAYVIGLEFHQGFAALDFHKELINVEPKRFDVIYDNGFLFGAVDTFLFDCMQKCPFVTKKQQPAVQKGEVLQSAMIAGLLPYRTGERLLHRLTNAFSDYVGPFGLGPLECHLLMHDSLVNRVFAKPNDDDYCKASILVHGFFDVEVVSTSYPLESFVPPPREGSYQHVRLTPKKSADILVSFDDFEVALRMLFLRKRSPIGTAIGALGPGAQSLLSDTGIDPHTVVSRLTQEQLGAIVRRYAVWPHKGFARD